MSADRTEETLQPTLRNIIELETLRWIFVGGKGGVGKTICSCSLAVQLAKVRSNVLIISTDPAHNISDTFDQKLHSNPTIIRGFDNLYAMEIDPTSYVSDEPIMSFLENFNNELNFDLWNNVKDSIPGIDEALTFVTILKLVDNMNKFSVVVFDTAPTGHTLRLLSFPDTIERILEKVLNLRTFFPIIREIFSAIGCPGLSDRRMTGNLEDVLDSVKTLNKQLTDPELTTFVCVCNANFLSLYENERLIQELAASKIDTRNIIVNQLHLPISETVGTSSNDECKLCSAWRNIEAKYLDQIADLYEQDFHVVKLPLMNKEIRGVEEITEFSQLLLGENNIEKINK